MSNQGTGSDKPKQPWRTVIIGLPTLRKLLAGEGVDLPSQGINLIPDDVLWNANKKDPDFPPAGTCAAPQSAFRIPIKFSDKIPQYTDFRGTEALKIEESDNVPCDAAKGIPYSFTPYVEDLQSQINRLKDLIDLRTGPDGYPINERLDRTIDHVNREIGVAQEMPLHARLSRINTGSESTINTMKAVVKDINNLFSQVKGLGDAFSKDITRLEKRLGPEELSWAEAIAGRRSIIERLKPLEEFVEKARIDKPKKSRKTRRRK
jgi:hypothetical protein